MTPRQQEAIKEKIIQELAFLSPKITVLQEISQPISPECALGDLARFELMHEQEVSDKSLREAQIRLKKLQYALRKVDGADYGLCMECEEEISFERLLLLPESSHCIRCASNL
ncbi:MAG: TraR/DksA C4-type zinc finger protein [Campylobacterales bacterium]|nr:TraR/DksA C4-type zinc finger protein [Campylobacterales bacterium]